MEYITKKVKFQPPPPPFHLHLMVLKLLFYTQTQCSFVSNTHVYKPCSLLFAVKKHDSFHTVNKIEPHFVQALKIDIYSNSFVSPTRMYVFWLTITSQIESIRSMIQYTLLYESEQFESRIS